MPKTRKSEVVELLDRFPEPVFSERELVFTPEEKEAIAGFKEKYQEPEGAVMNALWLAQKKFGFLPPEVIRLVADELGIAYSQAYGAATFYTQYFKEKKGKYVLDVCTCYSCQVCGGYDVLHYLEEKLGIKKGQTTEDGLFTIQEAECLGACGSAPMLQVANGTYVHFLTEERVDSLVAGLRDGKMPEFVSITLPQDEEEVGGNRRSDAANVESYRTSPVSKTLE
jgi:NADH-quinone oxidoreductase subunit E